MLSYETFNLYVIFVKQILDKKINMQENILKIFEYFFLDISDRQNEIARQYIAENIDELIDRPNSGIDSGQFTANIFRYLGYQITEPIREGDDPIPRYATEDRFYILHYK